MSTVAAFPTPPRPPTPLGLLESVRTGSKAMADLCGRWSPMLPTDADLAEAEAGFERLRETLAALRDCMGGTPDAA